MFSWNFSSLVHILKRVYSIRYPIRCDHTVSIASLEILHSQCTRGPIKRLFKSCETVMILNWTPIYISSTDLHYTKTSSTRLDPWVTYKVCAVFICHYIRRVSTHCHVEKLWSYYLYSFQVKTQTLELEWSLLKISKEHRPVFFL